MRLRRAREGTWSLRRGMAFLTVARSTSLVAEKTEPTNAAHPRTRTRTRPPHPSGDTAGARAHGHGHTGCAERAARSKGGEKYSNCSPAPHAARHHAIAQAH